MAMVEIDPAFIQAIEHRPKRTIIEAEQIPIVDLALVSSLDSLSNDNNNDDDTIISSAADVVADIGDACQKWGFFQVINHGVPPEKLEKIEMAVREFFSLPMEEKRKVRRDTANPLGYFEAEHTKNVRDWKEVFDCTFAHDPIVTPATLDDLQPKQLTNRWPQYPAELREACEAYGREVEKLALKLLELIGLSLGLATDRLKGFFFKEAEHTNTSFIRLNRYPPCPSPHLALGVGPHKDSGALTILFQDEVGGLQVRRKSDGEWISVKPTPGAYIVNVGDIIQVWSNDKYESVEHRVMLNSDKDRISIPFFFNPLHSVMVKPLEELVNEHNPANYEEYNWGKFFASRKRLSEICCFTVSQLLMLGKSIISNANKTQEEDAAEDLVNIEWPEDSLEKAKVIRMKAQSMTGSVEVVSSSFITDNLFTYLSLAALFSPVKISS